MKVLGILAANIAFDSRAKRAFSAISDISDLDVVYVNGSSENTQRYPYRIHGVQGGRLSSNIVRLFIKSCSVLKSNKYDLIYAEGLFPLLIAWAISLFKKTPVVYDGREIYLKDKKGFSTYSSLHRLIEKKSIKAANVVLAANEYRLKFVKEFYGDRYKYSFIRNVPEIDVNCLDFLEKKKKEERTIIYQGALGHSRGLDKLIKSLEFLPQNIKLIMVVPEKDFHIVESMTASLDKSARERCQLKKFMPHGELMKLMSNMDLGVVTYELMGLNNTYCEPNKLYEYAYAGLPILSSCQNIFLDTFKEFQIGTALSKDAWIKSDIKKIAKEIEYALDCEYKTEDFKKFANTFQAKFEQEKIKKCCREVLQGGSV